MDVYRLSRDGVARDEESYSLGQLQAMYAAGRVTASSTVCRVGEDLWIPVDEVMNPPPKVGRVILVKRSGCGTIFMFFVGVAIAFVFSRGFGLFDASGSILVAAGVVAAGSFLMGMAMGLDIASGHHECCECGNLVKKVTPVCPGCKAALK